MNKGDLIESVASELGESKAMAGKAIDAVLRSIVSGVHNDERVSIAGFGTFRKRYRKARQGLNPATRQPIEIRASTSISFTPSQQLRNELTHNGAEAR